MSATALAPSPVAATAPALALAPLPYYWPRAQVFDFYAAIAATPVELVYLGETVCSRRHELRLGDWIELARLLRAAGKTALLSTQVLLESGSEVSAMQRVVANGEFEVEANDMGAVGVLSAAGLPFVAGPHLNLYNGPALEWIAALGAKRWVAALELRREDLALLQARRPAALQTEVLVHGRLPLAFSARCFTARHHRLPKDDCQFRCLEHPEGLLLRTREQSEFLVLNGLQTQSAQVHSLIDCWADLVALGVEVARIVPQALHTADVIDLYHAVRCGQLDAAAARSALLELLPSADCNGYWHGQPGLARVATAPWARS